MSHPVDAQVPVAFRRPPPRLLQPQHRLRTALLQLIARVRALRAACRFETIKTEVGR